LQIGIEALGIHYFGGGRTATLNLLDALLDFDEKNHYHVFLSQPEPLLNARSERVFQHISPLKNRFLVRIWAQFAIPLLTRKYSLVHFVKNLGVFSIDPPTVITIYDLTTLIHPEIFPSFDVWYWKRIQPATLSSATRIISISKNTAIDLQKFYKIPAGKIEVIYPAIGSHFIQESKFRVADVRRKYRLPENYLIHVGRIDKKKNLTTLVRAFELCRREIAIPLKLVLVGKDYPKSPDSELRPTIDQLRLQNEVIFTGQVPDEDLPALYSGALLTVFPSIHEGFGLAPIEAMACGSPVIGNRAGAFQEAAADSAYLLDAIDAESIAKALLVVLKESDLRRQLSQSGLRRAAQFKGQVTAAQTLDLYSRIAR
jgi:glycosyltransferase involved in cell wall biosynthesis